MAPAAVAALGRHQEARLLRIPVDAAECDHTAQVHGLLEAVEGVVVVAQQAVEIRGSHGIPVPAQGQHPLGDEAIDPLQELALQLAGAHQSLAGDDQGPHRRGGHAVRRPTRFAVGTVPRRPVRPAARHSLDGEAARCEDDRMPPHCGVPRVGAQRRCPRVGPPPSPLTQDAPHALRHGLGGTDVRGQHFLEAAGGDLHAVTEGHLERQPRELSGREVHPHATYPRPLPSLLLIAPETPLAKARLHQPVDALKQLLAPRRDLALLGPRRRVLAQRRIERQGVDRHRVGLAQGNLIHLAEQALDERRIR